MNSSHGRSAATPWRTCFDFHKIINTEEKRRGVEALGSDMIGKLTYYERWIVAFANILFQRAADTERTRPKDG